MKTSTAFKHHFKATKIAVQSDLAILNNGAHAIHRFVKKYTWISIFLVAMTSFVSAYCQIHNARAERDTLVHENYCLQQSLDSLRIIVGKD